MPRHRAVAEVSGNAFTLLWSPEMMLTFLRVLEEQDNLGKRSGTGWKPEAWNECRDAVQQAYTGTGQITIDKLKSKVEYV